MDVSSALDAQRRLTDVGGTMAQTKLNIRPLSACGKKRHYSITVAERHKDQLASLERRHRPSSPPLTIYHCAQCDAYHVGHTS